MQDLKDALSHFDVPRGTGFYIRNQDDVYVCWRDNNCVCVMSNEYPGHQDGTVQRSGKNSQGVHEVVDVPLPSAIKHYNLFMGGVDKSDQLISYHGIVSCNADPLLASIFYYDVIWSARRGLVNSLYPTCSGGR